MRRGESGISCLIGIDKPTGLSSHDVVNRVRRILGERRVGHAGTLDPLASGVLVVGVGQATRLLGIMTLDDKRYRATVVFGVETETDDAEGSVISRKAVPAEVADEGFARARVEALVGDHDQVPPRYSAVSVGGRRSYARARAGEDVDLPARHIRILDARLVSVESGETPSWTVDLHVSKGTYVRSIARDLGRDLGCGAYLGALRRTASGCVGAGDCSPLADIEEVGPALALAGCLDPVATLGFPKRELSASELDDVRCGRHIDLGRVCGPAGEAVTVAEDGRVSVVSEGRLLGVWRRRAGVLVSEASFPEGIMGVRA